MKTGPVEKIYEAYTAIADKRIEFAEDGNKAHVRSSDNSKIYTIAWEGNAYSSNDSATYWQGYCGYPVIAVLMEQGLLPLNRDTAALFAGVNWHELNNKHKRNYAAALEEVIRERGISLGSLQQETEEVYAKMKELDVVLKRGKR